MAVKSLRVLAVATLAAFAACGGSPLKIGDGGTARQGGGAGIDGSAGSDCQGLDETTCTMTPGCSAEICTSCCNRKTFSACYRFGDNPPVVCVAPPCATSACAP